jgi:hypothetical protein
MAGSVRVLIHKASQRVERFFSFSCSPVACPWFKLTAEETPAARLHSFIFEWQWKNRRKIKLIIEAFLWPLKSALLACKNVQKFGKTISEEYHVSKMTQLRKMLYLANFYNIPPASYYHFRLFEDGKIMKAGSYFQDSHMFVLFSALYKDSRMGIVDISGIDDKVHFYKQCKNYGLPVPAVFAVFDENGKEEWFEARPGQLPSRDLFIKFTNSSCGTGGEKWIYEGSSDTWRRGFRRFDKIQLKAYCLKKSVESKRPVMVQGCLANDEETIRFSSGALCTFRVITSLFPGEKAGVLFAGLKMPVGDMDVDNLGAGGLASGIDPETGVLSPAGSKFRANLFDRHPDTDAKIAGRQLACWQKIADLGKRAQECFHWPWSVGWDIAMTARGPVLIEGNTHYGFDLLQIFLRKPLGETNFPELYFKALRGAHLQPESSGAGRL